MYTVIGADLKEYGPITAEQLRQWIREGRANAQTKIKSEGATEWRSLSELAEFAAELRPGAAPPPFAGPLLNPEAFANEILARDYEVDFASCVSRGWELVKKHFWLLVGASFVIGLIQSAIPFLAAVCLGGMFGLCLKLIRGEHAEFGDAFSGFSLAFVQLFLGGLVEALLIAVGFALCIFPGIYLAVAWKFALPLIIDKKLDFWPAMELSRKVVTKHWWQLFALLLVNGLVIVLGFLACCVGIFVATPVALASMAYAYDDIFGARRSVVP